MTFIDDNGNQLEFIGKFAMTKQAVSFFNGSIKGDVSINFSVDNNSINRNVLNYFGPQMTGQVAWTKQAFNRIRNGNVIDRGYIVIQNEEGDYLNCFYVSGNSNWVQLLNGLITDLDFTGVTNGTDYNVTWNAASVISRATATDGIIFPLVDWAYDLDMGKGSGDAKYYACYSLLDNRNTLDFSYQDFYPCFYVSSLVTEILQQNGLKLAGNLINDPIYKSLIITPHNGTMRRDSFKNVYAVGSAQSFASGVTQKYTSFTEVSDPDGLFSNNSYTANKKASVYFNLTNVTRTGTGITTVSVYKNGVSVYSTGWIMNGYSAKSTLLNCVFGDVFEVYVTNAVGPAYSATINVLIETPVIISNGDYVNPSNFLPPLKNLDVIKFCFNYFGCSVNFSDSSKTITANIIEKIQTDTASDWSEYYQSHRSEYTVNQAQNNYMKWNKNVTDVDIKNYNDSHVVNFGDGNITTGNTLKKDNDILNLPFNVSAFGLAKNSVNLANIPLINLVDEGDPIPYTGTFLDSNGVTIYTVPVGSVINSTIARITNSSGVNLGYFLFVGSDDDPSYFGFLSYFSSTDTGNIYPQRFASQEVGARILTVKPNTSFADFSNGSSFTLFSSLNAGTTETSIPYAVFTKPIVTDTIDQWKNNLAIDNPDSGGFVDPTIKQLYFNKISKFLQNPDVRCQMTLPESVYQSFAFDQFIYLKTKNLTGYFFVDSIVNYIDANTPVEVNLYML